MISSLDPTVLVVFGATGDVVAKKILPALYDLFASQALPSKFRILGFSRRPFSSEEFRSYVAETLASRGVGKDDAGLQRFLEMVSYEQGQPDVPEDYRRLSAACQKIDGELNASMGRVFYLGVPPTLYEPIARNLAEAGLMSNDGSARNKILVEKPIGTDAESAERIDGLLRSLFAEEQMYRIEHYLAKEMLRAIPPFRFANALFESMWNREHIERVEIRLWETLGVEHRGAFYDGIGALRDVGQNHALQMLALVAMDRPADDSAASIRLQRQRILETLRVLSAEDVKRDTYRARYSGYRSIEGVQPDSTTETYFKLRATLDHPRWRGVPFILEAGKRLHEQRKEIIVTLKNSDGKNRIVFSLEPEEGIRIEMRMKKPGYAMELEPRTMEFVLRHQAERRQYVEEYANVIVSALHGDQTPFVSAGELRAMWRFADPILNAWQTDPSSLAAYAPDTDEAIRASRFLTDFVFEDR